MTRATGLTAPGEGRRPRWPHVLVILVFVAGVSWLALYQPQATAIWGRILVLEVRRLLQGLL